MLDSSGNYRRRNLRGRSFKKQDLTNEDFSGADIRGADFTNANLTGANFNYALAGLKKSQVRVIFIFIVILSIISGIATFIATYIPIRFILPKPDEPIPIHIGVVIFLLLEFVNFGLLVMTILQGIQKALGYLFPIIPLIMLIISILAPFGLRDIKVVGWLNFFGITEIPSNQAVEFSAWLKGFRISSIVEAVTRLLTDAGSVNIIVNIIVSLAVSIAVILVLIFTLSLAVVLAEIIATKWLADLAVVGAATLAVIVTGIITKNADDYYKDKMSYLWMVVILAIGISLLLILIANYLAKKILAEDEKNIFIRRVAVAIGAMGGTSFRNANLTDSNFSHATLKSTDFRLANATRTCWRQANYLTFARVGTTILIDPKVRDLLVTGKGRNQQYISVNLRGANLISADLSGANLKLADLSESALQAADLDNANLTEALAIGTNFTCAQMTGSCVDSWNIDHTTILDDVESKYVYLLESPKPGTDDKERRPSSGYFALGEFTKLFQEILNTVDLIFNHGVDAKAFMSSFKQVQVENEGTPMTIQGMENKGDGVVVIKINVPPEANKAKIHQEFVQIYGETVELLEKRYQTELVGREKEITLYRQQNENMMFLVNEILKTPTTRMNKILLEKVVILSFNQGSFETGFTTIQAQIWSDGNFLPIAFPGKLPPNLEIPQLYQQWHQKYEDLRESYSYKDLGLMLRIKPKKQEETNFSKKDIEKEINKLISQIQELEKKWRSLLNNWLNSPNFSHIENQLRTKINQSDKVRLIIQSEDILMQRIPWHLWDFFQDYRFAETAISLPEGNRVEKLPTPREKIRILAIVGDDTGINIEADKQHLSNLPDAETVFLIKPNRQELDKSLWDEKGWNIICFSGHSQSEVDGSSGYFYLGNQTKLTIEELENALTTAISRGLQLAIFNSCDGLGLARQLAKLHIPEIIVMREPVPDLVAQEFLKNFLKLFASGKSLYISVREARQMLQGMEDKFPCASWLPVICQNPAEMPPSWRDLHGISQYNSQHKFEEALAELRSAIDAETWLTPEDKISALKQVDILAKVGEFSTRENQVLIRSAIGKLRIILAEHPAANLMAEALNNLSFTYFNLSFTYFLNQGNNE